MLHDHITIAVCRKIIVYPYERVEKDDVRFIDFATKCSEMWGGSVDDWVQANKHLLGFFGSKKKIIEKETKFRFPKYLVQEAIERWFEQFGIPRTPSPSSVSPSTSSPDVLLVV